MKAAGVLARASRYVARGSPLPAGPESGAQPGARVLMRWSSNNASRSVLTTDSIEATTTSARLRDIMRRVPHNVCVVTAVQYPSNGPPSPIEPEPRGMTVSSFTCLSVDPQQVTFNVRLPSTTYDALASSGRFNIHILQNSLEGAMVADHFARGNLTGRFAFEDTSRLPVKIDHAKDRWTYVPLSERDAESETPTLRGSILTTPALTGQAVLCVLHCSVLGAKSGDRTGLVNLGSHAIVVGDILDWTLRSDLEQNDMALVYADRSYRKILDNWDLSAVGQGHRRSADDVAELRTTAKDARNRTSSWINNRGKHIAPAMDQSKK